MPSISSGSAIPPDESKGPTLLILTCSLLALTIITTCLRLYARYHRKLLGWDDYTIATCVLFVIARTAVQIISVPRGNGRYRAYLSAEEYQHINFLAWMAQMFLFISLCLLKCSICLLILRLKNTRVLNICMYVMMVGLVATNALPLVVFLAGCHPIKKFWIPTTPGKCWNMKVRSYSIYTQCAFSIIADLIFSLLPIAILWNEKMIFRVKVAVALLMSIGLIATTCAVLRATSYRFPATDMSHSSCVVAIWANTELHLGITATNIALAPSIYALYSHRGSLFGTKDALSTTRSRTLSGYPDTISSQISGRGLINSDNASVDEEGAYGYAMDRWVVEITGNKCNENEVPFSPVIRKTTEFSVTEGRGTLVSVHTITQNSWNVEADDKTFRHHCR